MQPLYSRMPRPVIQSVWIVLGIFLILNASRIEGINVAWMAVSRYTFFFNASTALGALAYSKNEIEADPTRLPGQTFNVRWKDSGCGSKAAVGAIFNYLEDPTFKPDLVLGPICSGAMAPVAQLCSYLNLPVFGWITSDPPLADKDLYSTLVRFLWSINILGKGISILSERAGWKRASIISSVGGDYHVLAEAVKDALETDPDFLIQRWVSGLEEKPSADVIADSLNKVKDEARIIILVVRENELRNWTMGAYDLDMWRGEYVLIYTNQRTPEEALYNQLTSRSFWEQGDGRDQDVQKAMENLIMVFSKTVPFATSNAFIADFDRAGRAWVNAPVLPADPDFYSLFLYDALKVYSRFATSTGSINNGRRIFDAARSSLTTGGATGNIILGPTSDRIADYWFLDMGANQTFTIAAETRTTLVGSIKTELVIMDGFRWGDGSSGIDNAPKDAPECGFHGELCRDITVYWVVPLVVVVLAVIIGVAVFFYRRWKYEQNLNNLTWKLNYDDMALYMGNRLPGSQMNLRAQSTNLRKSKASVGDSLVGEQLFITVANYKGTLVAIRKVAKPQGVKLDRDLLLEMKRMTEIKQNNLNTFVGACTDPGKEVCCCWEYCAKGSLQDVIFNENINLDDMFKFSITVDVIKGVGYLHESSLRVHGQLKSSNVVIDGRWACKITDFGMETFCEGAEPDPEQSDYAKYSKLFWTAPEVLRDCCTDDDISSMSDTCRCHSSQGDVYSIGIIMKETFCRNSPYQEVEDDFDPKDIVGRVAYPEKDPFRPVLTGLPSSLESKKEVGEKLQALIAQCCNEDPSARPSTAQALKTLTKTSPFKKTNVVDNMAAMMEKYSKQLEEIVASRTLELVEEQKKTEDLLFKMLPKSVANDLKQGKDVSAESYDSVTIYFSDIPGFGDLVADCTPFMVVDILNGIYSLMDETINIRDVYKVETVGDVYVLVSGLPIRNGDRHVVEVVDCALELITNVMTFKVPHKPNYQLAIRIGINTGPIVTGVVGLTNPRYCLFGDTMNTASRMESNGKPLRIHLSNTAHAALSKFGGYQLANRGEIPVKGKGMMNTYWLVGRDNYTGKLPDYRAQLAKDEPKPTFMPATVGKTTNPKVMRPSTESGFVEMSEDSRKNSSISNATSTQRQSVTSQGGMTVIDVTSEPSRPVSPPSQPPPPSVTVQVEHDAPTSGGLTVVDVTSQ